MIFRTLIFLLLVSSSVVAQESGTAETAKQEKPNPLPVPVWNADGVMDEVPFRPEVYLPGYAKHGSEDRIAATEKKDNAAHSATPEKTGVMQSVIDKLKDRTVLNGILVAVLLAVFVLYRLRGSKSRLP